MTNLDKGRTDDQLASDLRTLYAAEVPDLAFDYPAQQARPDLARRVFKWVWRPALGAAAAAAVAAAMLLLPNLGGSGGDVSAEEIFERTSAAAEGAVPAGGAVSYHLIATSGSPGQPGTAAQETWFQDVSHVRTQSSSSDGKGAPAFEFGQVVNGDEAWIYMTSDGLYVAHGPSEALGAFGLGLPEQGHESLSSLLAQYNSPCQAASESGEDELLGRAVYVIDIGLDRDNCLGVDGDPHALDGKYLDMTLWVDKETFLPLKIEQRNIGGDAEYQYVVSEIQVGAQIPEVTFVYAPPEGATVTEVTTIEDAKMALSGTTASAGTAEYESCPPPAEGDSNAKPC